MSRTKGPRWSYRGGLIAGSEEALEKLERDQRTLDDAPPKPDAAAAEANALDAALQRTPHGRRMLELMTEIAELRIHEALAAELVRGAAETVAGLRRDLVGGGDYLKLHRTAGKLPGAEQELAKWQRALTDYRNRRERVEGEVAYGMRAFA